MQFRCTTVPHGAKQSRCKVKAELLTTSPLLLTTTLCFSIAKPRLAIPRPLDSLRLLAIAGRCSSLLRCAIARQILSPLLRYLAVPRITVAPLRPGGLLPAVADLR